MLTGVVVLDLHFSDPWFRDGKNIYLVSPTNILTMLPTMLKRPKFLPADPDLGCGFFTLDSG